MIKENQVDKNRVSLDEYQAWERSKQVKSNQEAANINVIEANNISIVDYARKNGLSIISETQQEAVIEDPATGEQIVVNKTTNSWSGKDLDGSNENGRMIRFHLKVNRIYPESRKEYIQQINKLVEQKALYKTNEEYNNDYSKATATKEPNTIIQRENKKKHAETVLANSISIMDIAKKKNYVIISEDDVVAKIKDVITERDITVRKDSNTWYGYNPDGKWTNGKAIRFIARMEEMEHIAASDYLLENRAKFLTSEEYNEQYKEKMQPEKVTSNQQEKTDKQNDEVEEQNQISNEEVVAEKNQYTKEQLAEIINGVRKGIDVKPYDKLELSPEQMREIRIGIEQGIDLSEYAEKTVPAAYIKEVRLAISTGLDTTIFKLRDNHCMYTPEQAKEIRLGLKNNLSNEKIGIFAKKELTPNVMRELRLGLQSGFDIMKDFSNGHYKAEDIHTIRMNLSVKKLIDILKEKLTNLFEFISNAFVSTVQRQTPILPKQEIEAEANMEVRDLVKDVIENLESMLSSQPEEQRNLIYQKVFEKIVENGKAINEITQEGVTESFEKAESAYIKAVQQAQLERSAFESLKQEYSDELSQIVEAENIKIAEFAQKLIDDPNMTTEQKYELIQGTLGQEFGEDIAKRLVEHLPEPIEQEPDVLLMQQEIMEYYEDFEMEQ